MTGRARPAVDTGDDTAPPLRRAPQAGGGRLETLVRLAMEAFEGWTQETDLEDARDAFERAVRERMAQAAAAWELEAPMATLAEVDRALDRARVLTETVDRMADEARVLRRDVYLLEGKLESTRAALGDEARAHEETRRKLAALVEAGRLAAHRLNGHPSRSNVIVARATIHDAVARAEPEPTNMERVTASAAVNSVQSGTEFGEAFARAAKGETR